MTDYRLNIQMDPINLIEINFEEKKNILTLTGKQDLPK